MERNLCQVASVRIDAGFPEDELLAALEERGTPHVARVKNNAVLDRLAEPHLARPGELFLHHFFLITNWTAEQMDGENLLELYRQRGTAEGHYGELAGVLDPALSSSPRPKRHDRGRQPQERFPSADSFLINETLLLLNALAYNIAHAARVPLEVATGEGWSLQRFRERVLRTAARVLIHGGRATLILGHISGAYWPAILPKLRMLRFAEVE